MGWFRDTFSMISDLSRWFGENCRLIDAVCCNCASSFILLQLLTQPPLQNDGMSWEWVGDKCYFLGFCWWWWCAGWVGGQWTALLANACSTVRMMKKNSRWLVRLCTFSFLPHLVTYYLLMFLFMQTRRSCTFSFTWWLILPLRFNDPR